MPEHNFGNNYTDLYLRTGRLPQQHVKNAADPLVGYPKLQQLHALKDKENAKHNHKPFGKQASPSEMAAILRDWHRKGVLFDVTLVGGCTVRPPTLKALMDLPIRKLTARPSLLFIWVPSDALETARTALEHWGFRRSEDIVYFAHSRSSPDFPPLVSSNNAVILKTTWHCLMGLKGTLRRSEDGHMINCNVDTDVIFEVPGQKLNIVPEKLYNVIENFCLIRRRVHIVPEYVDLNRPVRPRPGWVILSPISGSMTSLQRRTPSTAPITRSKSTRKSTCYGPRRPRAGNRPSRPLTPLSPLRHEIHQARDVVT